MRIVIISDWFAEKMGYSENLLPKALAALGAEVHLITSDLQPDLPNYAETYEPFLGPRIQPVVTKSMNGFTLHRLPHGRQGHGIELKGLLPLLRSLRPDVVQVFTIPSFCTYQTLLAKLRVPFKLFLEEHIHKSVFAPKLKGRIFFSIFRWTVGKVISAASERCYPIAQDVAEIVTQSFGIAGSKTVVCSLGVDTDLFHPVRSKEDSADRDRRRKALGFGPYDIVSVYSGRFHEGKGPLTLARAIASLQSRDPRFKGLFIGSGTPAEIAAISSTPGCVIHPFVESWNLPGLYRAADIGVWPRQESTSQLDAASCGLPIIISDRVTTHERVEGNGFLHKENDAEDLAAKLLLLQDPAVRSKMGMRGMEKMREQFSWEHIARERLKDYEAAVARS